MRFKKIVLFSLTSTMISVFTKAEASYDIEMFTFYPFHCESNLMKQMKKVFHSELFVETGTLGAETAFTASVVFDWVHSVELSEAHYNNAKNKNIYSNVFLYHDSSDHFLDIFLPEVRNKRKLFWLDAHYSGGNTATLIEEATGLCKSPIWGELTAIFKNGLQKSIILIDDISGYLLDPASDMRYPHLHHQYDLIIKNCQTAEFYIIGDLAIVYDSVYHNPTISPIVQACTTSRMFDWYTSSFEDERAVLTAEYDLSQRCNENEADRICYLSGYCNCRDYRLWRGLIHLGRANFAQAAQDFQYVLDAGMTHWRIEFYIAYALANAQRNIQAQGIFRKINSHLKNHEQFLELIYPKIT